MQVLQGEHTYEGEFLDDLKHGTGVLKSLNGYIYEGEFKYDKKHG